MSSIMDLQQQIVTKLGTPLDKCERYTGGTSQCIGGVRIGVASGGKVTGAATQLVMAVSSGKGTHPSAGEGGGASCT